MSKPHRIKTDTSMALAGWAFVCSIGCVLVGAIVYFALGLA
jgi:hypothetical protein